MRRATALVVAAGLLAITLTGCSSDPNASCDTALQPGKASDLVTATGKLGTKPTVSFPTPIDTTKSQRSTLIEGDGAQIQKGQMVELQYSLFDGKTGAVGGTSSYESSDPLLVPVGAISIPALNTGLLCTRVGDRVAIAIAPKDAGTQAPDGSVVAVIDVVGSFLPKANGTPQPSVSGFPTVVLAPTGQPGITIPGHAAPTSVKTETLLAGGGETVKKDSKVVLHYTAVGWDAKTVTASTWTNGSPDQVTIDTGESAQNQALPQSMTKALVGKKVGSQVVVLTPKTDQVPALAWVVDILGVR
ncbi:FKBP-type peptidyl-prolyl cis-trans isomerase [Leifsonia sp. NPDC058292]|uniref:FKBP-type peptidyl-prolyl cis-trans isomerase n=1 Tax=Leifsonia sp. NPDC058292 TaxID=3346428 RepID=UPI0036DDE4CA